MVLAMKLLLSFFFLVESVNAHCLVFVNAREHLRKESESLQMPVARGGAVPNVI